MIQENILNPNPTLQNIKNAINTVNQYAVSTSGDTMTGDLNIKHNSMDTTATTLSSTCARTIYFLDKNNEKIGFNYYSEDTNGTIRGSYGVRKKVDGSNVDNVLNLSVNKNGNMSIAIPNEAKAPWRNALGLGTISTSNSEDYLPITGGILTGGLNIQSLNADVTATASTVTERYYKVVDKNASSFSLFGGSQFTNGDVYTSVVAQRKNQSNQNIQNYLYLITTSTGEKRISISDPTAWREALVPTAEQKAYWRKRLGYLGMNFDEVLDSRNYNASIPSTADLNTLEYCTTGKYYCTLGAADVQKIQNCPTRVGFQMLVFKTYGVTGGGTNVALTVDSVWKDHVRIIMDYRGHMWSQQIVVNNSTVSYGSWQPLYELLDECTYTSTNLFSGTFKFRRVNKWVQMTCTDFIPKVQITDSSWVNVGSFTTNTKFLPLYNTTVGIGSRTIANANGMLQIKTNGDLSFTGYKGNSISTSATYTMSATYIAQN